MASIESTERFAISGPSNQDQPTFLRRFAQVSVFILPCLGLFVAGTLSLGRWLAIPTPCGVSDGCAKVAQSTFSHLFGIPVSFIGAAYYLFAAAFGYLILVRPQSRSYLKMGYGISGAAALISVGLIFVSISQIGALCTWCLGSAFSATLSFLAYGALIDRPTQPIRGTLPLLLAAAVGVMGGWAVLGDQMRKSVPPVKYSASAVAAAHLSALVPEDVATAGPADSRRTVVVFSSFSCGGCADAVPKLYKLAQEGRVRLVYRTLPIGKHSVAPEIASVLARDKGQFWKYQELAFASSLTDDDLLRILRECGVAESEARRRLPDESDRCWKNMQRDARLAKELGISSTPTAILIEGDSRKVMVAHQAVTYISQSR